MSQHIDKLRYNKIHLAVYVIFHQTQLQKGPGYACHVVICDKEAQKSLRGCEFHPSLDTAAAHSYPSPVQIAALQDSSTSSNQQSGGLQPFRLCCMAYLLLLDRSLFPPSSALEMSSLQVSSLFLILLSCSFSCWFCPLGNVGFCIPASMVT